MLRHIAMMLALTFAALAAGIYMVPGPREQWTMLIRDERNAEALDLLEKHYQAGDRDPETLLQLYKLLMSFAQIERATTVIQELVAERPGDIFALTLLAKHYGDTQDALNETTTLERLFVAQPSSATAQRLLLLYRLGGRTLEERRLLGELLADKMITADDAERLGFMLAAETDLQGARQALSVFDAKASPASSTGRFALFNVLLRLGEPKAAMAMAEHWLLEWRNSHLVQGRAGRDFPLGRLTQVMADVDLPETRRIICNVFPERSPFNTGAFKSRPLTCAPPQQVNGSVAIDAEDIAEPSVFVRAKGIVGDRSAH
jgi:hypothetical protein